MHSLLVSSLLTLAPAETPPEPTASAAPPRFVRFVMDERGEAVRLDTAIVRYRSQSNEKVEVDLIAAIHIADASYYQQLQQRFESYDRLLFELVKPEGARVPGGPRESSPGVLTMFADLGLDLLQLASQTDCLDYRKDNFLHADLSPLEMLHAIQERGDNLMSVGLRVMSDMIREENQRSTETSDAFEDLDLFALVFEEQGALQLKRTLARQLARDTSGFGPTLHDILITDRNKACMKVLEQQLAAGDEKLAIFYGAAHMEDFHQRLVKLGFVAEKTDWLHAWKLR